MTAMGIAMVVAVFVMTMAIAQGFRGALVASGSNENAILLRKGGDLGDGQRRAALATAADRGDAAGRARRRPPAGLVRAGRDHRAAAAVRQPAGQRAGARRRPEGVRGPRHAEVRRRTPLHAGHARDQRRQGRRRPLQGPHARQRREVRQRDLEGGRRLHGRRCGVRVGSVGRRRSDDAGVPAQRLPVDDRQARRSVDVRLVHRDDLVRPPRAYLKAYRERDYYDEQSRATDHADSACLRCVRHRIIPQPSAPCSAR